MIVYFIANMIIKKILRFIIVLIFSILSISCSNNKIGIPQLNTAEVIGNYPDTYFLYYIPTQGIRPMEWNVKGLPEGLSLDSNTGIISGNAQKGEYVINIKAVNSIGEDSKTITLSIGNKLLLTPPMGWNSWNTFGANISEKLILEMADSLISSGMQDVGYQYINIDDLWQLADRDKNGHIQIDSVKFPRGIKYIADYLHKKGLKLGVYSDAARYTCAGVAGSLGFEKVDAEDFAKWGVDLLKYDYCGAPKDRDTAFVRYKKMGDALKSSNRSIVYSICEWGERKPWLWAKEAGGHYWRTTWDIRDKWKSEEYTSSNNSILTILERNAKLNKYSEPGAWNDPDMLVVGISGKSKSINHGSEEFGCSVEQYKSHMAMWCMMNAPLLCGNDLRNMDDVTKDILTNVELIRINQDKLGKQAEVIISDEKIMVMKKELSDHRTAISVLNKSEDMEYEVDLNDYFENNAFEIFSNKNISPNTVKLKPSEARVYLLKD